MQSPGFDGYLQNKQQWPQYWTLSRDSTNQSPPYRTSLSVLGELQAIRQITFQPAKCWLYVSLIPKNSIALC